MKIITYPAFALVAFACFAVLPSAQAVVNKNDFNRDGHPDLVLTGSGGQTAIWYLNNNVMIGGAFGPAVPSPWLPVGTGDFNGDGHPDLVLVQPFTGQTAIWYLNNNVMIGGAFGPAVPFEWFFVGIGDFNGDGHPDFVLRNSVTFQTAIWYLNNNVMIGGAFGPTPPGEWSVVGIGDFNGDGHPDFVLVNNTIVEHPTAIWYLNNNVFVGGVFGPAVPSASGWQFAGIADFNGDGHPDYLFLNALTNQTAIWYLNNNVMISGAFGPTLPSSDWFPVNTN